MNAYRQLNWGAKQRVVRLHRQPDYLQYRAYVGTHVKNVEEVVAKSYLYDLKYHTKMNLSYMQQLLVDLGIACNHHFFKNYQMTLLYKRAQEEVKLKKCAVSLLNNLKHESKEDTLTREIVAAAAAYACDMSFDLKDYYTYIEDCKRNASAIETYYRSQCRDLVIAAYEGCARCHVSHDEEHPLRLIHLWKEKSECGNFVMRSRKGHYINNCIPLCEACNAEKGAHSLFLFFSQDEMIELLHISQSLDQQVNHQMKGFKDVYFPNRRKFD